MKERNLPEDVPTEALAETENYMAWVSEEPDGEIVYHLEFGSVTVHFFREEWDEFLKLMQELRKNST